MDTQAPTVAVVGPGAIGTTIAAMLHGAGHRVQVCGRTPREVIEVRPDDAAPIVVPGRVHTDPAEVDGPVGVVMLAVKDTQTRAAAAWLAQLCDQHTVVCALQNGVEQSVRVGPYCPGATVVPAAVWFSAETNADGSVRLRTPVRIVLPDEPSAVTVAALLRDGPCTVELSADFVTDAWRKLVVNALAGFMVLTGRRSGMFRRDDVASLARRYLAECLAVARADGANLDDAVIEDLIGLFSRGPEDITTSILTDREMGRPLEWDVRNGVIIRKAAEYGLTTPTSDVVVPLLAAASDGPG